MSRRGEVNPRAANRSKRAKYRARFRAMDAPCAICGGRLGPIHYDEPSDPRHPLSFVIDERIPVSRWREFGYGSAREAAEDWSNLQAAHYCCNAAKSNRTMSELKASFDKKSSAGGARRRFQVISDGDW